MRRKTKDCHPEMAGCGIEYSLGKAKWYYRRNNIVKTGIFRTKVERCISDENLTLERIWKFERRARSYKHLYMEIESAVEEKKLSREDINFDMLEKIRKVFKTHRNIAEIERKFIYSC